MNFHLKYKKYKLKYIELKQKGGSSSDTSTELLTNICLMNEQRCIEIINAMPEILISGEMGIKALKEAAYYCLIEVCSLLLDKGVIINHASYFGETALKNAIICRDTMEKKLELCRLLLSRGANPNHKMPLLEAISRNMVEVARLLLDSGAILEGDDLQLPSLIHCVQYRSIDICRLIFERLAVQIPVIDHSLLSTYCSTALIEAARDPKISDELLELLIHHGANINYANPEFRDGYTALQMAVHQNNKNFFKYIVLLEGVDKTELIRTEFPRGETILHKACRFEDLDTAIFLTEQLPYEIIIQTNHDGLDALTVWGNGCNRLNTRPNKNFTFEEKEDKKVFSDHVNIMFADLKYKNNNIFIFL